MSNYKPNGQALASGVALVVGSIVVLWSTPSASVEDQPDVNSKQDVINEIRFEGNRVTRPQTMLQEMSLRIGDPVNAKMIERSRQDIMDLGLFKSVDASLLPDDDGQVLTITVDEKRYFFALPKLNRSGDGDVSYGAQVQFDNLFGLNQQLEATFRKKDLSDGDVSEEKTFDIDFTYPRIRGSPFQLEFDLDIDNSELDEDRRGDQGQFERKREGLRFVIARWKDSHGPSKGWRYSGGISWQQFDHTFISGNPDLFFDATVVALLGSIAYDNVHDFLFSQAGRQYGYEIEAPLSILGSDREYFSHFLYYRRFRPITSRPHTNLNYQLRLGYATDTTFGEPAVSLGSSSTLRGYERDAIEGDKFFLANIEFLTPIFHRNALRVAAFADIGNAYDDFDDIDSEGLKVGVGFGIRYTLRSFVKTDLRLDIARGVNNDGVTKVYGSTKMPF
ncbi:MAG: BamA/TamA family outer membrane protein [Gammaproteobacteria bacterium]|nr:BamA/TamA family outer membrane protein [Gammaproteobacteria bacterium]